MRGLTENDRAALQSRMSDDSVAALLSRSTGWVRRQRMLLTAPTPQALKATDPSRAEIIEKLEDEFDLLCLGRPSAWRIDQALKAVTA